MNKPLIGIVSMMTSGEKQAADGLHMPMAYVKAVERVGGIPLVLPVITDRQGLDQFPALCQGFLFTGGHDLSPSCYGEDPHPLLGPTDLRVDRFQLQLMKAALRSKKPVLAICRGIQVMNVACGGTLYQDCSLKSAEILKHMQETVPGEASHWIQMEKDSRLFELFGRKCFVNSYHHQSVKLPGQNLRVVARADDGIVEALEHQNHPFALGVQWHPEVMFAASPKMAPIFQSLVEAAARLCRVD